MLFWGNYATIILTDVLSERVLKMEFNIKLQELRKSRSLTQEELAAALYVSRTAVSKWESGRGLPGIDSLRAIAAYFGITIDELLSGDELLSLADNSAKKESHLRDVMVETYKDMFGRDASVEAIHAGLECGLFSEKLPGLDCVSIGPQMHDIHTSRERLEIASTERTWKFLLEVLKNL